MRPSVWVSLVFLYFAVCPVYTIWVNRCAILVCQAKRRATISTFRAQKCHAAFKVYHFESLCQKVICALLVAGAGYLLNHALHCFLPLFVLCKWDWPLTVDERKWVFRERIAWLISSRDFSFTVCLFFFFFWWCVAGLLESWSGPSCRQL